MSFFRVRPSYSDDAGEYVYEVIAKHRWQLPGVTCRACGESWANLGAYSPSIGDRDLPRALAQRLVSDNIDWPDYISLRDEVGKHVPDLLPVAVPGLEFGSFRGRRVGNVPQLFWWEYSVLAHHDAAPALAGLPNVRLVPAAIRGLSSVELEIAGRIHLDAALAPKSAACGVCGFVRWSAPQRLRVLSRGVSTGAALLRVHEFPAMVIANEEFVSLVTKHRLRGLQFEPIDEVGA